MKQVFRIYKYYLYLDVKPEQQCRMSRKKRLPGVRLDKSIIDMIRELHVSTTTANNAGQTTGECYLTC